MDPAHKVLLDEISKRFSDELSKRFDENDTSWIKRLSDRDMIWEQQLSDLKAAQEARVVVLEKVVGEMQDWRPEVDGSMDDIKLELKKLNKHFDRSALENPATAHGIVVSSPSAAGVPPAGVPSDWSRGHRHDNTHREDGYGSVTTVLHPPVKGTLNSHPPPPPPPRPRFHGSAYESSLSRSHGQETHISPTAHLTHW